MSAFTDHLDVRLLETLSGRPILRDGRTQWTVSRPLPYHVGAEGSAVVITVPAGFVTDFTSIPRPLWLIESPAGRALKAAVIHDFLYSRAGIVETGPDVIEKFSRSECDDIFREAMGVVGVPLLKRNLLWAGVRAGGWTGWGQ